MGSKITKYKNKKDENQQYDRMRLDSLMESPMPTGWAMKHTSKGDQYFINHLNRTTSWVDPRLKSEPKLCKQFKINLREKRNLPEYINDLSSKIEHTRTKILIEEVTDFFVKVSRENILMDSYNEIMSPEISVWDLKQRLKIEYKNEKGKDYGGMSRDWFFQLSQKLLDPELGLFVRPCEDRYEYHINPNSSTDFQSTNDNITDLDMFRFVGILMGMSMHHAKFLEFPMIIPFWRMLQAGEKSLNLEYTICNLEDVKRIDPIYWKSLDWMLENDVDVLGGDFSLTLQKKGGETIEHILKADENGEPIALTNENKQQYINLAVKYKIHDSVIPQMRKILEGFYDFLPSDVLEEFSIEEIPILFNGNSEIDLEDLRKNTNYDEGLSEWSELVIWFWEILEKWENDKRANFLQFVTGTKKVPVGGFINLFGSNGPQKFTIRAILDENEKNIKAHTCFNRLEIPLYTEKTDLEENLDGITKSTHLFGFDIE
eukprot:TRINITY_DN2303_c0_g1_i1.p1 TRINITY_DN2303_c0_g1~~TRINITY_DN2303_c0_g1_i1.p1  ORF type:complete len:487 (-),score=156.94 TRINITY_DN2303_c0_g1_i1:61-1521(-)